MLTWAVHSWSVVVPAKRLAVAKTRLRPLTAGLGGPAAHDDLVLALLADTVAAALACPVVGEVVVVTDDPAAAGRRPRLGARTVADEPDSGLNPALEHGARSAAGPGVAALSSDLPALRPEELAAALARPRPACPRAFVADAARHRHDAAHRRRDGAAPAVRPGVGRGARGDGAVPLAGDWPGLRPRRRHRGRPAGRAGAGCRAVAPRRCRAAASDRA